MTEADRKTILVTGFSPFPGAPVNPTQQLMQSLPDRLAAPPPGIRFSFHVLPTTWTGRQDVTDKLRQNIKPVAIVHFGVDGTRPEINIETRAVNKTDQVRPDAAGKLPDEPELAAGAEQARASTLPAEPLRAAACLADAPAVLSDDAGTYLCNATLWDSIGSGIPSIFVHVPKLPDGPDDQRPEFSKVEDAAVLILEEVARQMV